MTGARTNNGTCGLIRCNAKNLTRGFKKPCELMWVIGVILAVLTFSFGVTGYSLPWDQIGYWASLSKDFYNQSYKRFQIIIKHFRGSWDFNFLEMGKIFGIRKRICLYFLIWFFSFPLFKQFLYYG